MHSTYYVVAGLCLLGLAIRTSYELLKKAGRIDSRNKAVFAVVFAAMCTMLGSWPLMVPLDPVQFFMPNLVQDLGIGLVAVGCTLAVVGLVQLRGVENIGHLVTTGLYAHLRHPMYMGFILWILGWSVRYGAVVSMALGILCIGNIFFWEHLEERAMEAQYGEEYRAYRKRTWL
ncbi:MAG: isoprenylcysteine carboxylmethyltransferase family protein [Candidatus Brocadiia bacterium]